MDSARRPKPFASGTQWDHDDVADVLSEAVATRATGPLGAVVREHHGYRQRGAAPARHLGLPSPFLTVIFSLDEPLRIARHVEPAQPPGAYETLVGGLHTSPAVIEHDGSQSGIQLQLSPLGARALFGVPAGVLAGVDVCGSDLLGARAAAVREQLGEAASWRTRFQILDRELGRHLAEHRRPPAEVCQAWRMLRRSAGTASIAQVAREVGWSDRQLAREFRREIGLTPKAAARVIRFDRARRLLPCHTGAVVAAECGYADQAHLVREFVAFAGLSPTRWLAEEVRNLQVSAGPNEPDLVT
jgi:AraC-like DNA-binding protein